jgi:hypothetical protein
MNNNKLHSDSYGEAKELAYFSEFIKKDCMTREEY